LLPRIERILLSTLCWLGKDLKANRRGDNCFIVDLESIHRRKSEVLCDRRAIGKERVPEE
jgi:hypothetical protein